MENLALQRLTLQIKFVPTDVNHIEVFMWTEIVLMYFLCFPVRDNCIA